VTAIAEYDDAKAMEFFRTFARELRDAIWAFHERRTGKETKEQLLEMYLDRVEAIEEICKQQHRAIDHLNGKPVAPQAHMAEVALHGRGGQ